MRRRAAHPKVFFPMASITLSFAMPCSRDEAARFAAVELLLDALATDPDAQAPVELSDIFGGRAREAILALVVHPEPLGLTCRYDRSTGLLTLHAVEGRPNLAALPVLLVWLYPQKLPIAYSVHVTERPEHKVWTLVGLNRIEVTRDTGEVSVRLEALRASGDVSRRFDLSPPLPRSYA